MKKWIALLLAMILTFGMIACGTSDVPDDGDDSSSSDTETPDSTPDESGDTENTDNKKPAVGENEMPFVSAN